MVTLLLLAVIYITFIGLGLPDSLLGTIWPAMYEELDVGISAQGILSVIVSVGTVISSISSAAIMKKFSTCTIIIVSVFMTALAIIGISLSSIFWPLIIISLVLGLGAGCIDSCLNSFVAEHYSPMHMSWLHCFWGIGATLGPVILSFYLAKSMWKQGTMAIGLIQIAITAVLIFSIPLWKKIDRAEETEIEEKNSITYKKALGRHGVFATLMAFFFYCGIEQTAGHWGASFLNICRGISLDTAARMVSVYFLGIATGRLLSGFLTLKVSNKTLINLGGIFIFVGSLLIGFTKSEILLWAAFILIGLGCAPIFPCLISETPHSFGKIYTQSIMGLQMAFSYLGIAILPPVFGLIAENHSGLFPYYILGMDILMFVSVLNLNRRTKLNK